MSDYEPDNANGTGITKPGQASPMPAEVQRDLPCYTILVHGVNDLGETYEAQERGICEGLNARLGRCDLQPATYKMPSKKHDDHLEDDPDSVFFKRTIVDPAACRSPIIPFYWGFREEEERINKGEAHGQWLDRFRNKLDKRGAKEGGPFANATSSLPDFWADGFQNKVLGFLDMNCFSDPLHPLHQALPRHYMILASKRLAVLIKIIRKRWEGAPINLVAHSQGCLVALLSQAFLAEEGLTPADCLIMNNPPYSFEEYHGWLEKAGMQGMQIQSTRARATTFKAIVNYMTANRDHVVGLDQLKDLGVAADTWDPSKDRDNRRKVYLYFSPDDRTVGMSSPQGIGWQGVPDEKLCRIAGKKQPIKILSELGERFFQRVFTARVREGQPTRVGEQGTYTLWKEGEAFWGEDLPWLRRTFAMSKPKVGETRVISGEPLPELFKPDLGEAVLSVTPVDAAIAVTNDGRDHGMSKDGQSKESLSLKMEDILDPRPHPSLGWGQDELSRRDVHEVESLLNKGKEKPDQVEILHAWKKSDGTLTVQRHETFNEARYRWQHDEGCANSFHSGIVGNSDHSRLAHTYDLAIGWANISKEEVDQKRHEENGAFVKYLCTIADWRYRDIRCLATIKYAGRIFADDDLSDGGISSVLQINADYYATGSLSAEIVNCSLPDKCVISETVKQEELGLDGPPTPRPVSTSQQYAQVIS